MREGNNADSVWCDGEILISAQFENARSDNRARRWARQYADKRKRGKPLPTNQAANTLLSAVKPATWPALRSPQTNSGSTISLGGAVSGVPSAASGYSKIRPSKLRMMTRFLFLLKT